MKTWELLMTDRHTRRDFLGEAAILAAGVLLGMPYYARAQTTDTVDVLLDWLPQGPNCGFHVAQQKGFYGQAGITVRISAGKGSGSTAQLVANGVAQIGFVDGYVMGNSVAKGMSLKTVASVFRRNPCAIITLEESGIEKASSLEGKRVGIPVGAAQFQQFPAFAKGAGIDKSKVEIVNVDPAGAAAALIAGKVDAIAGFAQGWVPSVEIRGNKKTNIIWFADNGVQVVSNGLVVRGDFLEGNAELLKRFVPATLKGFLYARQNPDEAAKIIKAALPTSDIAISRREMELGFESWITPQTAGKPLGWGSTEDWSSTISILKQYGGVSADLIAADLFTNDFVPQSAEFVPPQN